MIVRESAISLSDQGTVDLLVGFLELPSRE